MLKMLFLTSLLLVSSSLFARPIECPSPSELKKALLKHQTRFLSRGGFEYKIEGLTPDKCQSTYSFNFMSVSLSKKTMSAQVACHYTPKHPAGGNIHLTMIFQASDKENFVFRPEDPDVWLPKGNKEFCSVDYKKCKFFLW